MIKFIVISKTLTYIFFTLCVIGFCGVGNGHVIHEDPQRRGEAIVLDFQGVVSVYTTARTRYDSNYKQSFKSILNCSIQIMYSPSLYDLFLFSIFPSYLIKLLNLNYESTAHICISIQLHRILSKYYFWLSLTIGQVLPVIPPPSPTVNPLEVTMVLENDLLYAITVK